MRRGLDDFGVRARLLGDLSHDTDEVIQSLASLSFGWLDHQRLVYDQWEVDGWRIHAKVKDTLGDVKCCDTIFFLLAFSRGNELVLADLRIGDLIIGCQLVFEVVRIENSALCNVQPAIRTIGANIRKGTHQHPEVALVSANF